MNWVQRKIYLYNVTFGLYILDWWERCLSIFNSVYHYNIPLASSQIMADTMVIVLTWFIFYNTSRYVTEFYKRHLS